MNEKEASKLAKGYLQSLPFREMFNSEPVRVNDRGEHYEVWFKRVVPSKPLHGLIRVRKISGDISWIPLT